MKNIPKYFYSRHTILSRLDFKGFVSGRILSLSDYENHSILYVRTTRPDKYHTTTPAGFKEHYNNLLGKM